MIFWLVFFPFSKHCGPFTKLSLNIQKKHVVFLCRTGRISNELEKVVQIYKMYHINYIAHKSSVFIFCKRSLTVKIHNQYLFIGFVLRISAHDRVITHKNKKNILRKPDGRRDANNCFIYYFDRKFAPPPFLDFLIDSLPCLTIETSTKNIGNQN